MTCQELRAALVDHARDALNGIGSQAAIESHLEHCHTCATEFARQRALTQALRVVARASAHEVPQPALEERLMEAFAAQHSHAAPVVRRRLAPWLAAAASIAIVGGVSYGLWSRSGGSEIREVRSKPEATDVRLKPDATKADAAKPDATDVPQANPPRVPSTARPVARTASRPGLRIEDFVALPGAIGLPSFESGRIVRVDLPVSSLPAYGVELVPDAAHTEVQADVLVGQDGQARAIRLVATSSARGGVRP
jgi:hypothetical protein